MSNAEIKLINTADRELARAASIRPDLIVAEGDAAIPLAAEIFRSARMGLIVQAERVERAVAALRRADSDSEWSREWSRAFTQLETEVEKLVAAVRAAKRRLADS